jgi:signal peptidase II
MNFAPSEWWILIAAWSALLLDQVSKFAALRSLSATPLRLAPGVRLILVRNVRGGMFGISKTWATTLTLAAVTGILMLVCTSTPITARRAAGLGLMMGGAVGNLVDRFARGAVTDFIGIWRWPTFNVADAALCIGLTITIAGFV